MGFPYYVFKPETEIKTRFLWKCDKTKKHSESVRKVCISTSWMTPIRAMIVVMSFWTQWTEPIGLCISTERYGSLLVYLDIFTINTIALWILLILLDMFVSHLRIFKWKLIIKLFPEEFRRSICEFPFIDFAYFERSDCRMRISRIPALVISFLMWISMNRYRRGRLYVAPAS